MSQLEPLIDTFGRVHNNLRISVTDRWNIRCFCPLRAAVAADVRDRRMSNC